MNRTEYIGKLNALYVGDKNCLEELITAYDEKDQEIERLKNIIKEVREYINEYAWQEDIINGIWTTTGEPVKDRYMQLDWDNCNELLEILGKGDE